MSAFIQFFEAKYETKLDDSFNIREKERFKRRGRIDGAYLPSESRVSCDYETWLVV